MTLALDRRTLVIFGGYLSTFVVAGVGNLLAVPGLVAFVLATVALAAGAVAVGEATERLAERLTPAATGIIQAILGNLPELFLSIFALQAGLTNVVLAALVGSVLGNAVFVLGFALLLGGLRHGILGFAGSANRLLAVQLLLAVAALTVPFLAVQPGEPDFGRGVELSVVVSVVLLVVFAFSIPVALRAGAAGQGTTPANPPSMDLDRDAADGKPAGRGHSLRTTILLLAISAGSAALVADWFVEALRPAMATLGMSEAFAGLVVVALSGNAVEHLAGVTAAWRGRADLALSLILNSALQVVLFLAPVIVLLSHVLAPAPLVLILDPLLLGALAVSALLVFAIVLDGDANALEGAALLGLYAILAAAVWWGPPIPA